MFIVLFHSMFGLRAVEMAAAKRLRAKGYQVVVPDLFAGETAGGDRDAGYELMRQVGWPTIMHRARKTLVEVPEKAVLAGFSMGAGVIGSIWPERLHAAAVLCLHAPTTVPHGVLPDTPVQLHVGTADDQFGSDEQIATFLESARRAEAAASVHRYPGAGHFFTDKSLPEFDAAATASTWNRVLSFLETVRAHQE